MDEEFLILEQIEYYRRRSSEYDETSSLPDHPISRYLEPIEEALDAFCPRGDVLEIASGTGTWTNLLLKHASSVTALDSSNEMHEEARTKLRSHKNVRFLEADIFSWQPDERYDVVFFANWLSHVPPGHFDRFWSLLTTALATNGRVFLVDEAKDAWRNYELLREDFVSDPSSPIVRRRTQDGKIFHVVKVFWDPAELQTRLHELGWQIAVDTAGPFFWAYGSRTREVPPH